MKFFDVNKYKKIILLTIWLSFFLSINLNPTEYFDFNYFNKLRLITPLILSIIFTILLFNKVKFSKLYKFPNIFFGIICLSYVYFNLENSLNDKINMFWPIYMFLSIFILGVFTNYNEKILLLKFTIFIVIIGFLFYFLFAIKHSISNNNFHFYGIFGGSLGYSDFQNPPRSSGLARFSLLIYIALTLFYIFKEKNKNYILLFLIFIFSLITILFQSRTISFIFLVVNFLFITLYFKKFFFDKRLIFVTLLFPIIINIFYNINIHLINTNYYEKTPLSSKLFGISGSKLLKISKDSVIRNASKENYSSGRFNNWISAIEIIKKNPLNGIGAQADRIYLNQSIHNAFLYSFLSGGLIASISIALIYLYSMWLLLRFFYLNLIDRNNDFIANYCAFLIIIFCLRSILETSFAVFSIDYLIFILAILLLNDYFLYSKKS